VRRRAGIGGDQLHANCYGFWRRAAKNLVAIQTIIHSIQRFEAKVEIPAENHHLVRTAAVLIFLLAGLAFPARAQNFTVNSTRDKTDQTPGDGICSTGSTNPDGSAECTLRAAIQESNASSGAHVITLPAGTYNLTLPTPCTYEIAGDGFQTPTSLELCFAGQITVQGAGALLTIIDAGHVDRAAQVSGTAVVVLQGLTIQNGTLPLNSGSFEGGCINNQGNVSLIQTTLTGCTGGEGGAIYTAGTLNIVNSSLTGNSARQDGGAVSNNGGNVSISFSALNLNAATDSGGAVASVAPNSVTTITETVISGNTASGGGGIINAAGLVTVTNTTISGNTVSNSGGGIQTGNGTTVMNNLTIARNTASNRGGGFIGNTGFTIANSIIAGNTIAGKEADCASDFIGPPAGVSLGYNLIQDATGCMFTGNTATNITGVDPMLAPLAGNVMALLPGSPAIDAGNPSAPGSGGSSCAIIDQRGIFRPQGTRCDIGAFEATPGLFISSIFPAQGGSGGVVTVLVSGNGILSGATLQLQRSGQPAIVASPVAEDPGQVSITGTFNLTGAALGTWDVVVTNPDATMVKLIGGFTIAAPQSPKIYTSLQGRSAIRGGLPAVFSILISNRGNNDVFGVPLSVSAPTGFVFELLFPVPPPPSNASQVITNWTGSPLQVNTPQPGFNTVPLLIPVVPAGYTGVLTFLVELPLGLAHGDTFSMFALSGTPPYFNPSLDPGVVSKFVSAAQTYAQNVIGVTIPSTLTSSMQTYITNQLQSEVTEGRNDLVARGGQSDAFGVAQLVMDLAAFAAKQAGVSSIAAPLEDHSSEQAVVKTSSSKTFHRPRLLADDCHGQLIVPGQSGCGESPTPVPPGGPGGLPPGCSFSHPEKCGVSPGDCQALPGYHVSGDGSTCEPDGKRCPISVNDAGCRPYPIVQSGDPNDKAGPPGGGTANFLPGVQPLTYTITFENQATATAPAQKVVVTDQLDTANLDLSTFALGPISFGNQQVLPSIAQQQFTGGADLRPAKNIQVKIQAGLNRSTGVAAWTFSSIDPDTEQLTTDPLAGFLPPDVTPPQGLGTIMFTVMPKAGTTTNTTTCNQASIVFDLNSALSTPTWCNSFDVTPPVSHVTVLPATESTPSFLVQWSGTDVGSGISHFNIFVSDNGSPFTAFQTDTTATSATFTGQVGHAYGFYSIATDLVGNVEGAKTAPEADTTVSALTMLSAAQISTTASGLVYSRVSQTFTGTATIKNISGATINGPFQFVLTSLTNGVTLADATGTFNGSAYITVPSVSALVPGQSATVNLRFSDPSNAKINFTPVVYSGSFN
jgi:CSLREA domain-containing protein